MSSPNCCFLNTYRFLRRQVRWSDTPVCLRIFQFVVIHTVKGFSIVNEAEVDVFLEFFCFCQQMLAILSLVPWPFAKISLYVWKFLVHILFVEGSLGGF